MEDRRFGVEIEFASGGLGMSGVARILGEAFDKAGMRRWYFRDRMHYDGSEIELKTPILKGNEGFEKLHCVMDTLSNEGCYCTGSDGLHIQTSVHNCSLVRWIQ